jgi:hypothetical protein
MAAQSQTLKVRTSSRFCLQTAQRCEIADRRFWKILWSSEIAWKRIGRLSQGLAHSSDCKNTTYAEAIGRLPDSLGRKF